MMDRPTVPNLTCILHMGPEQSSNLKSFAENPSSWYKVQFISNKRKLSQKQSKYDAITKSLSNILQPEFGYHTECYKNFTAFSSSEIPIVDSPGPSSVTTRSKVLSPLQPSSSGVLPALCIFCDMNRKKIGGKWVLPGLNEKHETEIVIRDAAAKLGDEALLLKLGSYEFGEGADFVAKEVRYHHACKRTYLNKSRNANATAKEKRDSGRAKENSFNFVIEHIQKNVISQNKPEFATVLLERYKSRYIADQGNANNIKQYNVQNFCKRVRQHFPETELTINAENTRTTVMYKTGDVTFNDAFYQAKLSSERDDTIIYRCAMKLRNDILKIEHKPLEEPLTVENIIKGEATPPDSVKQFFTTLYTGSESNLENSSRKSRLVDSSAADAVYSCSGGRLLPGKQLALGLTLKSMTGSRSLVTLLNRFGHCASSETIRRVEMGMESTIQKNDSFVPSHIIKQPNLSIGFAWDNFDINLETPSGADTIHHTYGICYQNIPSTENIEVLPESVLPSGTSKKVIQFCKTRESEEFELEPYFKKPKMSMFEFSNVTFIPPESFHTASRLDKIWMISFNMLDIEIPMWSGWNTLRHIEKSPQQIVCYMQHIQNSPTRADVVRETIKRSQAVSRECGEEFTIVTYDLAVAKIAKQIQCEESPAYDTVFVMFGDFHIQLSLFSSIGKIIEGSGGPYLLIESGVIAAGSMTKFLKGKMYNRCRRGHTLLTSAMQSLHFQRFIDDINIPKNTLEELTHWASNDNLANNRDPTTNIVNLVEQYDKFLEDTLSGKLGKTAQFWMTYATLMSHNLLLQRAMKTNDVDLYAYTLFKTSSIFFSTNHQNYSRWMVLYSLELLNLKEKNLEMYNMLMNGGFSVNRTGNSFARVGVDMCLEQTINAEAKSRLKGIMPFADVSSAVNRWLVTSSMKTHLVNSLLEMVDITKTYDVNKELKKQRIDRDHRDLREIHKIISSTLNPFSPSINKEALFNIRTGTQASENVEGYLLNCITQGDAKRNEFLNGCIDNPDRFEEAIKKTNIINFATENFMKKNKSPKAAEIASAKGTRDMFARLLFLSVKHHLDLSKIFEYPLIPEAACFAHPDGTIRSCEKAAIFPRMCVGVTTVPPSHTNTVVVDGMFFLRANLSGLPLTYGALARTLLIKLLKLTAYRADICFDVYESPSIKDIKREDRGDEVTCCLFSLGPGQKLPRDIKNLLKLSAYKSELLRFFYKEFQNPIYANIVLNKIVYCAVDNECVKIYCADGMLKVEQVVELYGYHLEGDTRVMFHAKHADLHDPGNIVIRANDTDIAVVLASNANILQNSNIWYDSGNDHDNSRKYTDMTMLSNTFPNVEALPGLYAFTGNDYTPAFFRKGKEKPLNMMNKHQRFIDAFSALGSATLTDGLVDTLEEFVCHIYGYTKQKKLSDVLRLLFENKCKPKATKKPLTRIKSVEPTSFPPCKRVLFEHIKRAWYIAKLYKSASEAYPLYDLTALDFGWKLSDDNERLVINWFQGEQVPAEIETISIIENGGNDSEDELEDEEDESDSENEDDDL